MKSSFVLTYEILDGVILLNPGTITMYLCEVQDYGIQTKRVYLNDYSGTCEVTGRFVIFNGVEYGSLTQLAEDFQIHEQRFEQEFE